MIHMKPMSAALPISLEHIKAAAGQIAAAVSAWKGDPSNFEAGQTAFFHRAKMNSLARSGGYDESMERAA